MKSTRRPVLRRVSRDADLPGQAWIDHCDFIAGSRLTAVLPTPGVNPASPVLVHHARMGKREPTSAGTAGRTLWTIGHSTREWEVFVAMLREADIAALADVRRFPGSRRNPQFSGESMAHALPEAGIDYVPMPELGGRRKPEPDTRNTAWRNDGFRGYADYMETAPWQHARDRLAELAAEKRIAVMCAEALWWQCHRGLISDDFKAAGWDVVHLMAPGKSDSHPYTSAARIVDGKLDYSAPEPPQASLF